MSEKSCARQDASTISTIIGGVSLATIAFTYAPLAMKFVSVALVGVLIYAQYRQRKSLHSVIARSRIYYQLARRLVRLKRNRQRDTNLAINVLNHMVNQSDMASNTQIWQQPLGDFSGDIAITCESRCGKTYLLLADLTGHGIAAAIGATPVASIFQATAYRGLPVEQIVVELNDKLKRLLPFGYFCCAAVAVCDENSLQVCNAGLPDLMVCNASGKVVDRVTSTHIPLGIEKIGSNEINVFSKRYSQPHQLYGFTDGLIETRGLNDDIFDSGTVESIIAENSAGSNRLDQLVRHFESFSKGIQPHDDISIVEVKIC